MIIEDFAELKPDSTIASGHEKNLEACHSLHLSRIKNLYVTHSARLVWTVTLGYGRTGNEEELGEDSRHNGHVIALSLWR